jgi:NAD(P)-dependent dehydrogenase (short-subunit alcohol dehydrogenase family)
MKISPAFHEKIAIVTGATSGMGQSIALELASSGAWVIANGRNKTNGNQLEKESERIHFLAGDVKDPETNLALVEYAKSNYGRIDHLVLSAGQLGIGKLDEVSIEDWRDTFATNVDAVFYLLRHALPIMQKDGGGSIVIIGSIAAFHAFPNHPAYCASKGALVSLVRQVALDFGPSIRINLVCPAQVQTPLLEASARAFDDPQQILAQTAQRLPLKRLGTTSDISKAVLFLLSNASSWVTGTHFTIDGGFMAT